MILRDIVMIPLRVAVIGTQSSMWYLNEDIRTLDHSVYATVNGTFFRQGRNSVLAVQPVGGVRVVVANTPSPPLGAGGSPFTAPYQDYGASGVQREFRVVFIPDDMLIPYDLAITAVSRDTPH